MYCEGSVEILFHSKPANLVGNENISLHANPEKGS